MKYIVDKNLDVVYHDSETGMPRLVSALNVHMLSNYALERIGGQKPRKA
jgi:hypothetical protein